MVFGAAVGFDPDWLGFAIIVPRHGPRLRIGMIDGRDPVMQAIAIGRVEENALLDDGLIVRMERQPAGVDRARALHAAGLDLERAIAAVGVLVHPAADRIAFK